MGKFKFRTGSIADLAEDMINEFLYFETAIPAVIDKGNPKSKLLLISGQNASGKSFVRRLLCQLIKREIPNTEIMPISQEGRQMGGVQTAFIYGDESHESSGHISAKTVTTGISTCRNRTGRHVIIWDEPDLGLSEDYAAGVGQKIRDFALNAPELTYAIILITHSKPLVSQLVDTGLHHMRIGDFPSVNEWLSSGYTPRDPDELFERSNNTFQNILGILKKK